MYEITSQPIQCSFVHFLAYFNKTVSLDLFYSSSTYPKERSVLHYICLHGDTYLLRELLQVCPSYNINQSDSDGTSPLILAFKNKQRSLIRELLKFPILNLNQGSEKYGYPLHLGIKNHEFAIVKKILGQPSKYIVNINVRGQDGNNAMHFLMGHMSYDAQSCMQIATIMLKKGIDVNCLNKSEFSPIHVGIKSFQSKALKFALEYNQYMRNKFQTKNLQQKHINLFEPSNQRRISSINPFAHTKKQLSQQKTLPKTSQELFDFNLAGKNQWTPLHYAVFNNNLTAVELLLQAQAMEKINLFARDHEGKLAQELCPFNSPIYKLIIKRQKAIMQQQTSSYKDNKIKEPGFIVSSNVCHQVINRHYMKNVKATHQVGAGVKHSFIKRANSNGRLNDYSHGLNINSKDPLNFRLNHDDDEEAIGLKSARTNRQNYNNDQIKVNSNYAERSCGRLMHNSKTEKNLLDSKQEELYNINLQRVQRGMNAGTRSPRQINRLAPIAPKQLLSYEEDEVQLNLHQESINFKVLSKQEHVHFMSQPVNFESDHDFEDDTQHFMGFDESDWSLDESKEEARHSSESSSDIDLRRINIVMLQSFSHVQNKDYQSAPSRDLVKPQQDDAMDIPDTDPHLATTKILNIGGMACGDNDDEDFCDAADEDAEAGSLGLIANKINKFENHNSSTHNNAGEVKLSEKEALYKFMIDLQQSMLRPASKLYMKQKTSKKSPNKLRDVSAEAMFEYFDNEEVLVSQIDEDANVFDTVDYRGCNADSIFIDDPVSKQAELISSRNIKSRINLFIVEDNLTPQAENQIPFSRRSGTGNSVATLRLNHQASQGALCRMMELNKNCYMSTDAQHKMTISECTKILNDSEILNSKRMNVFYQFVMQEGRQETAMNLKLLYDNMKEDTIFKLETVYLMSVSMKGKELISTLDKSMQSFKKHRGIKDDRSKNTQMDKPQSAKLNLKTLIIYETRNSFDILMIAAMQQSKHQMESCNNRIYQERERSREKMKMRHAYSQQKLLNVNSMLDLKSSNTPFLSDISHIQLQMFTKKNNHIVAHDKSSINSSIRGVPELVARLNKSPSTQSFKSLKHSRKQISGSINESIISSGTGDVAESAAKMMSKASFTPKGSTGQVFLAFQRQKQQSRGQIQIQESPQSPIRDYDTQTHNIPHYKINLQQEEDYLLTTEQNNNYTMHTNINSIMHSSHSRMGLQEKQSPQININYHGNMLLNSPKHMSTSSFTIGAGMQQQQQKPLPQDQIQHKSNKSFFTAKQRELSQQIKYNLQKRGQVLEAYKQMQHHHNISVSSKAESLRVQSTSHQNLRYNPPIMQQSQPQLKKPKIAIKKLSPRSRFTDSSHHHAQDTMLMAIEATDSLPIKTLNSSNKPSRVQYNKPQSKQQINKQQPSGLAKHIKCNLSMESQGRQNASQMKKSMSTSKMTADTSVVTQQHFNNQY